MDVSGKRNDTTTDVCHRMGQHDTTNTKILFLFRFLKNEYVWVLGWGIRDPTTQNYKFILFECVSYSCRRTRRHTPDHAKTSSQWNFFGAQKNGKKTLFWDENLLLYSIPFFLSLLFSFLSFFFFLFFLFSLRARSARLNFFRSARASARKTGSFVFLFCTGSLHTYLPHGPYLFFLDFSNLAGMPLTNFSKYEYCSPGPFKLYECSIWATLCLNCWVVMILSCFRSSNSLSARSFLSCAHAVSMGLRSPLLGGNLKAVRPFLWFLLSTLRNPSLSIHIFNLLRPGP